MSYSNLLARSLRYGAVVMVGLIIVGGVLGYLADGWHGLSSALIGAGVTAVFLAMTAASILVAGRVAGGPESIGTFYGIVLGTWLLKLIIFVGLAIWLRGQPWLDPTVFGLTIIAAVIASLTVDIVAFVRTRVPYTDAALPAGGPRPAEKSPRDS